MNVLDALISFFAPALALRRTRARFQTNALTSARSYEAASKGRRTSGWVTPDVAAIIDSSALSTLRSRARHLVENNAYAARGVAGIVNNAVGAGIIPQARHPKEATAKALDELWKLWGDTTLCDVAEQHDFYGIQQLVMRTVVESGECLVRKIRLDSKAAADRPIPLALQVLDPDYLDSTRDTKTQKAGARITRGVETDEYGKPVAYWLFPEHPGGPFATKAESRRVPASDVLHVFRIDRPGQLRGVTWFAPVILNMRDLDEYEDAELVRHKIAACFAGFLVDNESPETSGTRDPFAERLEPGMLEFLPPGKDIRFAQPPSVQGYSEYTKSILHKIAVGLGVTYEILTSDLSETSYSSGRIGYNEFFNNIVTWREHILRPRLCGPVWRWFVEAASLAGGKYEGAGVQWTAPKKFMIDPQKDIAAEKDAVRSGFKTHSEAIRSFGYDPDDVYTEHASDKDKREKLGLIFDIDPSKVTMNGQFQSVKSAPEQAAEAAK